MSKRVLWPPADVYMETSCFYSYPLAGFAYYLCLYVTIYHRSPRRVLHQFNFFVEADEVRSRSFFHTQAQMLAYTEALFEGWRDEAVRLYMATTRGLPAARITFPDDDLIDSLKYAQDGWGIYGADALRPHPYGALGPHYFPSKEKSWCRNLDSRAGRVSPASWSRPSRSGSTRATSSAAIIRGTATR